MLPLIIIQARMNSTRLPQKVLKPLLERPLLSYNLERLKALKTPVKCLVATSNTPSDDPIEDFCQKSQIECFRGDEQNVLCRFYSCLQKHPSKVIVRLTGDCPLLDSALLDEMLALYQKDPVDYFSNVLTRSYPKGYDIEIFSDQALEKAYKQAKSDYDKEHVTPYIYHHPEMFSLKNYTSDENWSHINVSVDTPEDFDRVEFLIKNLYPQNPLFGLKELKAFLNSNAEIFSWIM